jgi:hypothetical protein
LASLREPKAILADVRWGLTPAALKTQSMTRLMSGKMNWDHGELLMFRAHRA